MSRGGFRPLRATWLLLLVALLAPAYDLLLPAGPFPPSGRRTVIIERGESLRAIATELQRAGLLHSPVGFLVLARLMNLDRHVKAGPSPATHRCMSDPDAQVGNPCRVFFSTNCVVWGRCVTSTAWS